MEDDDDDELEFDMGATATEEGVNEKKEDVENDDPSVETRL